MINVIILHNALRMSWEFVIFFSPDLGPFRSWILSTELDLGTEKAHTSCLV